MRAGEFFYETDISGRAVAPRAYHFELPHGVPVRFHDVSTLIERSNVRMIEFHLSYRDLELDPFDFLSGPLALEFAVHAPELFAGDHTLDLCSPDRAYRAHSIRELQRVITLTRALKARFAASPRPRIVVNVGGFSEHGFLDDGARRDLHGRLQDSLSALDREGVELIAQTMPPFPWHFGGQRHHNLFVSADDIAETCRRLDLRVCLDVSHSYLACTHFRWDFFQFIERVAPFAVHLHIGDARGVDGEGLQIGEGEIDFQALGAQLRRLTPQATWVPEVWQGHKNDGEGFWRAFSRLEGAF
jgi:sugar phosphate isomerase/epimerase